MLANVLKRDFRLFTDIINAQEEALLYKFFMKKLDRTHRAGYASQHFDKVITHYRECSYTLPSSADAQVCESGQLMRRLLTDKILPLTKYDDHEGGLALQQGLVLEKLMPCHVLDLAPGGSIDFHVDHVDVILLFHVCFT